MPQNVMWIFLSVVISFSTASAYNGFNSSWDKLPQAEHFRSFYEYSQTLKTDLDSGQADSLKYSKKSGTSVYFTVNHEGKRGAWLPKNSATNPRGETFAFNIGRLLKADPYLVGPGIEMPLRKSGRALLWFNKKLRSGSFRNRHKEQNRVSIISQISRASRELFGVYALWGPKPRDYDQIVNWRAGTNGQLRTSHSLAAKLKCRGSALRHVKIPVGTTVDGVKYGYEDDLVRQLSTILIIDALNLQWDRFSGGNLQVIRHPVTNTVAFVSYDNGGTSDSLVGLAKTFANKITHSWVGRYDTQVAERLIAVHDFLEGRGELDDFTSEEELKQAMGVRNTSQWQKKWKSFKKVLANLAKVIRKKPARCFI